MTTRRAFLKSGSLAVAAFGVGGVPTFVNRAAAAAVATPLVRKRVLVGLFLRGAMDGLAAVQPLGHNDVARLRPNLYLRDGLIDLGTGLNGIDYGLHPSLEALTPFFRDGRLAIVHGVGSPDPTRSHFDAQDYMELGTPGRTNTANGWLARAAGALGHEAPAPFAAVALTPALPRCFAGYGNALAVADLDAFILGDGCTAAATEHLEALFAQPTAAPSRDASAAAEALNRLRAETPRGTGYPATALGQNLEQIARLVKGGVGLEVAFAEMGGWDTHVGQGSRQGSFARQARDLAQSLAAFYADLGPFASDVVVITMTEFGRTVQTNASGGTDHGRASAMFVLGDSVRGGLYGSVEGFAPDALEDRRDLPVTTDFRRLFAGVASGHLGVDAQALFPGFDEPPMAVIR